MCASRGRSSCEHGPPGATSAAAIVYCEGAYDSLDGKTAHGLVRRSSRYTILSVIDSVRAGRDAGEVLDGRARGIPVAGGLRSALEAAEAGGQPATHLVIGLAPIGGVLGAEARASVAAALRSGLHVHAGLHEFLSDDDELARLAREHRVEIRDVRRPPPRRELHVFSGKISEVESLEVAVLGSDSAIGKRTTAWLLLDGLRHAGLSAELIGTGQTAWLQGAEYGTVVDTLPYDFVPGEIEHAIWTAWRERRPDALVLEGQGGLLSPGYFGGQELLLSALPDLVVLQHAPGRAEHDGCPGFPIEPLERQLEVVRALSRAEVIGVTLSREGLAAGTLSGLCERLSREHGLPVLDVLGEGVGPLVQAIDSRTRKKAGP